MANANLTDQQALCLSKALELYIEIEGHSPESAIREFQNLATQCLEDRFDRLIADLQDTSNS